MRFYWEQLVAGAVGIVTLVLAWFVGPLFHMTGTNAWILAGAVLLLGVIAIIGLLLYARSQHPRLPAGSPAVPSVGSLPSAGSIAGLGAAGSGDATAEIDLLIREAANKVAAARLGGAQLTSLPVVFLLGETGSGKTSVMMQSGLDAELLAGQVYQENELAPTLLANLWFAKKTIFVEAGGPLMENPVGWVRLLKRLVPRRFRALFGRGGGVPRAAIVCFDCETLAREVLPETIAGKARKLRARLDELSHQMGISLPVYVLFNRSDSIPYFEDFVGNFAGEETSQVLGTTLPFLSNVGTGVYAEQENRRLTAVFNELCLSLADCRPGLLNRERSAEKQAGVYEFPRQFRKLCKPVVQFLVDLCRPSHLRSGPFLRGFYFTGMKMVSVSSDAPNAVGMKTAFMPGTSEKFNPAATSLLSAEQRSAQAAWAGRTQFESPGELRKVSQSIFLSHIFSHIILQDRAALGASGASSRTDFTKRILLAIVSAVAFVLAIGFLASFLGNADLLSRVRRASQELSQVGPAGSQVPTADALGKLDSLRQAVSELRDFQNNGAPWHLRWGLFTGNAVFDDARALYFQNFARLLFSHAQQNLLTDLRGYRGDPQPTADSGAAYDDLKAYLLTTSEYTRNAGSFLSDFLVKEWNKGLEDPGAARKELIQEQFDFYSRELRIDNPFSKANDPGLVAQARAYLNKLASTQRIYFGMLAETRQKVKNYRFAAWHPEAVDVVHVGKDVDGPFTGDGWKVMDANLKDSGRFLQGEEWVLGPAKPQTTSTVGLEQELRSLYERDFINRWRDLLSSAVIVPYQNDADAAQKLAKLSANSSPLLALLCDISDNTASTSPTVQAAFQAPQYVVAPGCGKQQKYVQPANDLYMKGLLSVQSCAQQIAEAQPADKEAGKTLCAPITTQALGAADQVAVVGFTIDPAGHVDERTKDFLESPVKLLQKSWQKGPLSTAELCKAFAPLRAGFPFNAHATRDATLAEFNGFFQPATGMLSQFLAMAKGAVVLQGPVYVHAPGSPATVGANFLRFINSMNNIQQLVYPNNSPTPHFEYTVLAHLPELGGYKSEKLIFDGQALEVGESGQSGKFYWPGTSTPGAVLSLNSGGADINQQIEQGSWAVARFFSAYKWSAEENGYRIEGPLRGPTGQPQTLSDGRIVTIRFDVDFKGVPLFQPGYLSGFSCPAKMEQ